MRRTTRPGKFARPVHDPSGVSPLTTSPYRSDAPLLEARGIGIGFPGVRAVSSVDFDLFSGEVHAVVGENGAGKSTLGRLLSGGLIGDEGSLSVSGVERRFASPREAIAAGLALCPEDRKDEGIVPLLSVRENLVLAHRNSAKHSAVRNPARERQQAADNIAALKVKTSSSEAAISTLSGGNQQKVVLGKWLAREPRVLIVDEPTRGIDVGAKSEIYALMDQLAGAGVAIWMISSDLEEILGMSDRVAVLHEGHLAGVLERHQLSEEAIMHLATGGGTRQ